MGTSIYFDNYSPVGDILVVAICLVIAVLVSSSYVNKTKAFGIYLHIVFDLACAALVNVTLHTVFLSITNGNYTIVYILRIVYHFLLFSNLLMFVVYIVTIQRLEKERKIPVMAISTILYIGVLAGDIIMFVNGKGFRINPDRTSVKGFNLFALGYALFVVIIMFLLLSNGKRLYKRVMLALYGTIAISFLMLSIQGRHNQSSYTVASFLFPTLAMLYMIHSVPYDIELGAVNVNALEEMVYYNFRKKRDFIFMSLFLPDFDAEGRAFPKIVQDTIREFSVEFFEDAVLFQISNGHVVLFAQKRNNPKFEEKAQKLVEAFYREYEKLRYDYKIVIGYSQQEISRKNEYLSFIKSIHRNMNINEIHRVNEKDIEEYKEYENIYNQLNDINKKHNLDDERVLAFCQPVFNITTGEYDTAEALMRLELPGIGRAFPDKFIPIAEENGFIHVLTEIMLKKVCDEVHVLLEEGYEIKRVSVNVSALEIKEDNFIDDINTIINNSNIPSEKIAFEITETQNDEDFLVIKDKIAILKEKGIKFYLDDFGTGYSNMERILELPFDIIKFDRSLVLACDESERSQKMVGSLAGLFAELDYAVLYEGIETETDEKRCMGMSALYLQGYKYSRPIPIAELRNFFSKTASN